MKPEEKQRNYLLAEKLLAEQNFGAAIFAGVAGAILGAGIYGVLTTLLGATYGFAAVIVGVAVGLSIQYLGRGIDARFTLLAAVLTVVGCLLGNVVRVALHEARRNSDGVSGVFREFDFSDIVEWSVRYVTFIDLIFWCVAIWSAVFFAKRSLSRSERLAIGMYELRR